VRRCRSRFEVTVAFRGYKHSQVSENAIVHTVYSQRLSDVRLLLGFAWAFSSAHKRAVS
jgi:hypothetical protein